MQGSTGAARPTDDPGFILRPRLNTLLVKATKKPLTIVCAGMGCGKTRAVYDFTQELDLPIAWIQITGAGNMRLHLWGLYVRAIEKLNKPFANECRKLGFPDTEDKLNIYMDIERKMIHNIPCMFVFDDFHLLRDAAVLRFMERNFNNLPSHVSIILISREQPQVNISKLLIHNAISIITETDLNFTESEISQYLRERNFYAEIINTKQIFTDTNGWTFLINFVLRMLHNAPGYMGYVRDAVKADAFKLIETEIWDVISIRLKYFLLRLSLISHHSAELVATLADYDDGLLTELREQNAFIRYNNHMASWHIHPLLMEYLGTRIDLLPADQHPFTYLTTAKWCVRNNFIMDAIHCYANAQCYEAFVSTLVSRQSQFISDNSEQLYDIFRNIPERVYGEVDFFAALHIQVIFYAEGFDKALELAVRYEKHFLSLPDDAFKNKALGSIYYLIGFLHLVKSTFTNQFDFEPFFVKQYVCFGGASYNIKCWYQHPTGLWINMSGSSEAGAPQAFADALSKSSVYLQKCVNGMTAGSEDLCRGELLFYQNKIAEAKARLQSAIQKAMEREQRIIANRAMLYMLRIAVYEGNYITADQMITDIERLFVDYEHFTGVINRELSIAWYNLILNKTELIPNWLKEGFSPYTHASTLENYGNHVKAKYCYITKRYDLLLTYLKEKKLRESIIFERIEALILESLTYCKLNKANEAGALFKEAYQQAAPNQIIMPFIEPGKDMIPLINAVMNDPACGIPTLWLKETKHGALVYARNRDDMMAQYRRQKEWGGAVCLSAREKAVLEEMYKGFSNTEIADRFHLSVNTVKMHVSGIYNKLGARNKADALRIAAEQKLIS